MNRYGAKKNQFSSAVILASGSGTRFGDSRAKQFVLLDGIPVIIRSIAVFESSPLIHEIVLVVRKNDIEACRQLVKEYGFTKIVRIIEGGDTRRESAKKGFDAVNPSCKYVAIHDAARCLLTDGMLRDVMEAAFLHGGAACASRVTDTLKKSDGRDAITETIDRENVWAVQTPQVFLADMYRAASYLGERDGCTATDDCMLCERLGFKIHLVDCGKTNMKITYKEDMIIAKAILDYRKKEEKEKTKEKSEDV